MHRHGYKGRKFHRATGPRQALITGLAEAVIDHGQIETTLLKAKDALPLVEKLVTKAKKGGLHNRRQIIATLNNVALAHKLVDEIAPKLSGRDSGYLRIERLKHRRGDNAMTARLSFVDDISVKESVVAAKTTGSAAGPKTAASDNTQTVKKSPSANSTTETAKKVTDANGKASAKLNPLSKLTARLSGRQAPAKPTTANVPKKAAVRKTFQGSK